MKTHQKLVLLGTLFLIMTITSGPTWGKMADGPFSYSCANYDNCNSSLTTSTSQHSGYEDYQYNSETDHFAYFLDSNSAEVPLIPEEQLELLKNQLECGYRFFVCEKGFMAPEDPDDNEKIHIYIGDVGSGSNPSGFVTINDQYFDSSPPSYHLYTTPVHELFHLIQTGHLGSNYDLGQYDNINEATAVMAEQLIARENYIYSINKDYYHRAFGLTEPAITTPYYMNIFYRFVFEQLSGLSPTSDSWVSSTTVSARYLKKYLEHIRDNFDSYTDSDKTISAALDSFIANEKSGRSLISNLGNAEKNYITAQYAYPYVSSSAYPQYSFWLADSFQKNVDPLVFTGEQAITGFSTLSLSNAETQYVPPIGTYSPYGFLYYLTAEYHKLKVGGVANSIRIEKVTGDAYIKFQLIIRYVDNSLVVHQLFGGSATKIDVPLKDKDNIVDIIFVAYTTHYDPLASETGRIFEVKLKGVTAKGPLMM